MRNIGRPSTPSFSSPSQRRDHAGSGDHDRRDTVAAYVSAEDSTLFPYALELDTDLGPEALRRHLEDWSPWSVRIDFSNGVSTAEFDQLVPFVEAPLYKVSRIEELIPFEELRGGRVLDVGCSSGYNSIYLAQKYGLRPVGIEVQQRHVDAARFFCQTAGVDGEFSLDHAESFLRSEEFDVVLHLGTLYHLQNPLRSLQLSYLNLKPGGYLALETQCYEDPVDENHCYFMHGLNNDPSNFFALSTRALTVSLNLLGFTEVEECYRHATDVGGRPHMYRVALTARKQRTAAVAGEEWPLWARVD